MLQRQALPVPASLQVPRAPLLQVPPLPQALLPQVLLPQVPLLVSQRGPLAPAHRALHQQLALLERMKVQQLENQTGLTGF